MLWEGGGCRLAPSPSPIVLRFPVCVERLLLKLPVSGPLRGYSACAKRAAQPEPPVVPHPESLDAKAAYTEVTIHFLPSCFFSRVKVSRNDFSAPERGATSQIRSHTNPDSSESLSFLPSGGLGERDRRRWLATLACNCCSTVVCILTCCREGQ